MTFSEKKHLAIIEGLQIFAKNKSFGVCAQHDVLHAGASLEEPLPQEAADRLSKLGWLFEEETDCWFIFT